jgi:hypothetical protein
MANKTLLSLALLCILGIVVQAQNNNYNPLLDYNWYYNLNTLNQANNNNQANQPNNNANNNLANNLNRPAPRQESCVCNAVADPVCDYKTGITYHNQCESVCVKKFDTQPGRCGSRIPLRKARRQNCNCSEVRALVCVRTDFGWSDTFLNSCIAECRGFRNYYQGSC